MSPRRRPARSKRWAGFLLALAVNLLLFFRALTVLLPCDCKRLNDQRQTLAWDDR
jgi:hypothetical protein